MHTGELIAAARLWCDMGTEGDEGGLDVGRGGRGAARWPRTGRGARSALEEEPLPIGNTGGVSFTVHEFVVDLGT